MASLRQIRGRIKSVASSKQIMRAMQLVSASKLKRAQDRLLQARTVMEFLDGMLQRILAATTAPEHPLCAVREEGHSALVLFTSDAGLCGSYNANLIQLAEAHLRRDAAKTTHVIFIGKRAHRYFTKRGLTPLASYLELAGRPNAAKIEAIGLELMRHFLEGRVASIDLLYSPFRSSASCRPTILRWLPISLQTQDARHKTQDEYIFEPSAAHVFNELLPQWALATFQLITLEALTSEHSARMIAMKNATDNAQELLDALTLQRNKIRQAVITKELSEIVGTVEALK